MKTIAKTKPSCCGQIVTVDGTFYCDQKPVAAYSWTGAPYRYKGIPGAAVCWKHQAGLFEIGAQYPDLKLIEVLKKPKTLKDLSEDPRVTDISVETGSGDGIWVYLVAGLCSDPQTHQVHEDTVKDCISYLNDVKPCACDDCKAEAAGGEGLPMFVKAARKAAKRAAEVA